MRGRKRAYGWGSPKKHRGKGSRGGAGKAGMAGKKSQARIHMLIKKGIKRGPQKGFKRTYAKRLEAEKGINLADIELRLPLWLKKGIAKKKGDMYEIDLTKAGYRKVLGAGKVTQKLVIKAKSFSAGAKEKIEKAGGKAEVI